MEFTFRSHPFEVFVRFGRVYNLLEERFLSSAINVRFGKTIWSNANGWRKVGQ